MPELSAENRKRVETLAARLRFVESDHSDADAHTRRTAMEEVVQSEAVTIEPGQRDAFLRALGEVFPGWNPEGRSAGGEATPAQAGAPKSGGAGGLPAEPARQLQAFLGHGSTDALDSARVVELARLGAEFIASIDKSVSASWKAVASNSRIRHAAGARTTMARFAAGDPSVTRTQLQQELDRLRTLTGGLMSAVERAGEQFAQRHMERFSPSEIEAMAKLVPGAFVAQEAKCWRKYKEIAEHHDKAAIEQDVRSAIAEFTEKLVEGLGR